MKMKINNNPTNRALLSGLLATGLAAAAWADAPKMKYSTDIPANLAQTNFPASLNGATQ